MQRGVCRGVFVSDGPVSCSGKKQGKEPGKGGSPFAILPRQWETVQDRALDWQLSCGRLTTGSMYARPPLRGGSPRTESLAAAVGIQPVSFPRSGCRRRRDGRG